MLDDTIIITLVPGLVEVAKRTGLPTRFAPLTAIGFAIALSIASRLATDPTPISLMVVARLILTGVIDGLAAIGLYRFTPKMTNSSSSLKG